MGSLKETTAGKVSSGLFSDPPKRIAIRVAIWPNIDGMVENHTVNVCPPGETGRRERLKISFPKGSPGSIPGAGI